MKAFLKSVQEEMLATIQSICTSTQTPLVLGAMEPTPKDGSLSQECLLPKSGLSTSFSLYQRFPPPQLKLGKRMRWRKPKGRQNLSSLLMRSSCGPDSDVEDIKLSRHLFGLEDLEGLLQAIYATEEIPEPAKENSARDKMYRGLVKNQARVFPLRQSLKDLVLQEWKMPLQWPI